MTKADRAILERAFEAEINAALGALPVPLIQTRSKRAAKLADEGLLSVARVTLPGRFPVTITGYALTQAGRLAYCMSCEAGT